MSTPKLVAAVLAAGSSQRLGQPKQLIRYRGETLLNRALRLGSWLSQQPPVVVLGYEVDQIRRGLPSSARVVVHDAWQQGQGSSIAALVSCLPADVDAVLIMTVDQWSIPTLEWLSMLGIWKQEADSIIAAAYADTVGIPAIFPRRYFAQLSHLTGDRGAKELLLNDPGTIMVSMPHAAKDLDTPEDLAELEMFSGADELVENE